ncbi:MAG: HDIG domain-containing protein [Bacillota bacterium]|nr:HDIG domain-containing protein [Bacillota bacterium]
MIKRIRQFLICIFSSLNSQDIEYIDNKLDIDIKDIFLKLSKYEKKHSILVAQAVEKEFKNDPDLAKAALLHDIGKTKYHINIIQKSLLVLFDRLTKGKLKKITGNKSIYIFYNHGQMGYDILKNSGYNERILFIVKNHHNKNISSDDLRIIRKFDDMY